jgi:hypothetical protein
MLALTHAAAPAVASLSGLIAPPLLDQPHDGADEALCIERFV